MGTQGFGLSAGIARQEWLKPVEENLQSGIRKLYDKGEAGRRVKNAMHGTWIGHPLHVVLTDVPIGAWTAAIVFDLLDVVSGRQEFRAAADASISVGIVGALGAAVTGATDWQDVDPPARRIGLVHAALNVAGLGLFASSLFMRKKRSRAVGRSLGLLGYAITSAAANLGGNLVYEQRIGVDHSAAERLPDDFAAVLNESELVEGTPRRAMYRESPILLVRRGGKVFALAETCSHLGGPLSEGKIVDDTIQCPWHGSRFAIDSGKVVDGPAVHPQPCLETRVRNGQIEVRRFPAPGTTSEATAFSSQFEEKRTGTEG